MSYCAFSQEENKFPTCVAFAIAYRISGHFFYVPLQILKHIFLLYYVNVSNVWVLRKLACSASGVGRNQLRKLNMDKGRLNSFERGKKLFTTHRVCIED